MGRDPGQTKTRWEIETDIRELARRQIKAVKNATFAGWDPAELVAYEERSIRLTWLRKRLADLDAE